MLPAIFLHFSNIGLDFFLQSIKPVFNKNIMQGFAGNQILKRFPDRVKGRNRIGSHKPPTSSCGAKGIQHGREDVVFARILAVKQGKEEISVHTRKPAERGWPARQQGILFP